MQPSVTTNEATLTAHVSNTELHHQPPDHRRAPTPADGDILTDRARRTSPGATSAAASAQTRRDSPVRPPSPPQPVLPQKLSHVSVTNTAPIEESDT
eukprot:8279880-Pyramimonas_sp.AAC.1